MLFEPSTGGGRRAFLGGLRAMRRTLPGMHHVTAIAGDPQRNVDFYAGILGLRLCKKTVNFDDPGSYHLYYGDGLGRPGTVMTFFAWPGGARGRLGTGQPTATAFSIPPGSAAYWSRRLEANDVPVRPGRRFDDEVLGFDDPDGLPLELVAAEDDRRASWEAPAVPGEHAIRGFHSTTLSVTGHEATARLLTDSLGFRQMSEEGSRFRFETGAGGPHATVDVLVLPDAPPGVTAIGTVHHVAWRTPDGTQQLEWRELLGMAGFDVTPVLDRMYFRSIYFREPGGVLFEIATDGPGFTVDEAAAELGSSLKLPPWLEPRRSEVEARLKLLTTSRTAVSP